MKRSEVVGALFQAQAPGCFSRPDLVEDYEGSREGNADALLKAARQRTARSHLLQHLLQSVVVSD
jgi:hypothetical protein